MNTGGDTLLPEGSPDENFHNFLGFFAPKPPHFHLPGNVPDPGNTLGNVGFACGDHLIGDLDKE